MKVSKINKYDVLLFILLLCTAGGMWGGALKPARVFSILFFIPMISSYRKVKIGILKELIFFLAFLAIWSIFSLLWTPNIALGIPEWGNMVLRMLFIIELVVFGFLSKNTFNTIVYGWTAAFLITAIIAVWELTTGNHLDVTNYVEGAENVNLGGVGTFTRLFSQATFYNYNGYVAYICFCLPFIFSLAIKWNQVFKQLVVTIPLALIFYILIVNASRNGIVGFLVYSAFFLFYKLSKSKLSVKITLGVLIGGLICLFAYFWDMMSFYLELRLETGGMQSSRFQLWECSWRALIDSGFIGCGIGGVMDALTDHHALIPQPHNFFVEVLLEFGIIVFIWLIVLMWKTYRKGRKCREKTVKYIRNSSLLAMPFITMIDSGYVQQIGLWAFLGSLLLINVIGTNTNTLKAYKL